CASGAIRLRKATVLATVDFPAPIGPRRRTVLAQMFAEKSKTCCRRRPTLALLPGRSCSTSSAIRSPPGSAGRRTITTLDLSVLAELPAFSGFFIGSFGVLVLMIVAND